MASFEELQRLVSLTDTKTNLTALTGTLKEYVIALASDTHELGIYDGSAWVWIGGGGVTNIATGTGLSGGPITTTGTISLANTSVTAGSYTNPSLTIDAQGRITAASNGTGGSGKYRQFIYAISSGDFQFIKISTGDPVTVLLPLE